MKKMTAKEAIAMSKYIFIGMFAEHLFRVMRKELKEAGSEKDE